MTAATAQDARPIILVVEDDPSILDELARELDGRYGADYRVLQTRSAEEGLDHLAQLADTGAEVALLIADQWMPQMEGVAFLTRAHDLHPRAKRALLIDFGDAFTGPPILQAMALGRIDYYVVKPWSPADDMLHPLVTELLADWTRANRPRVAMIRIVGEEWEARSHELRDLLDRNAIPYVFHPESSEEGTRLLRETGTDSERLPAVILHGGGVLSQPSKVEIAEALGVKTTAPEGLFDVAIIGAGPAGLAAAVYGASEGLRTVVVESHAIGGQAGTSSLIRNYLGFPRGLSGSALAERAYQQAWLFGTEFVFMQKATTLRAEEDRRVITLSDGSEIQARAVVLATGVSYRRIEVPGIDALLGVGVFYGAATAEAQAMQDREVYVVGAGNSAGQAAVHLAKYARQVTMLVRGDSLTASMSDYLIKEIERIGNIDVLFRTEVTEGRGEHRLEGLVLQNSLTGESREMPADALFILIGATPETEWLEAARDEWGFLRTGRDLVEEEPVAWEIDRPPFLLETSIPGVFAVGDLRSKSVKRVASAVGEGSIVISFVHQYLDDP